MVCGDVVPVVNTPVPTPAATPSTTPSASPAPGSTATPAATPTPSPTPTLAPTPTPGPTSRPIDSNAPVITNWLFEPATGGQGTSVWLNFDVTPGVEVFDGKVWISWTLSTLSYVDPVTGTNVADYSTIIACGASGTPQDPAILACGVSSGTVNAQFQWNEAVVANNLTPYTTYQVCAVPQTTAAKGQNVLSGTGHRVCSIVTSGATPAPIVAPTPAPTTPAPTLWVAPTSTPMPTYFNIPLATLPSIPAPGSSPSTPSPASPPQVSHGLG